MRTHEPIGLGILLLGAMLCGCGGGGSGSGGGGNPPPVQAAAPTVATTAAQNGAVVASLSTTTAGASIYYTLDGSTPTSTSQIYAGPFLVASQLTVKAMAVAVGDTDSTVTSQSFTTVIPSGTLVWSDEFANSTNANAQPNPVVWTYETGNNGGWGNGELENYCAWGSNTSPCSTTTPNAYVGTDGYLHIVAEEPSASVYTSVRMKTEGLFSFQYGRLEASMMVPESQGLWPAFWLLGANFPSVNWPACGELDVMEHIDGNNTPFGGPAYPPAPGFDWVAGSVHGTDLTGTDQYHPAGFSAAAWHTYGMIWSPGSVAYYVDDPTQPYVTYTKSSFTGVGGAVWPFDDGPQFIIMNLAVGGNWPGAPDATTVFPSEVQVGYVRIYTN